MDWTLVLAAFLRCIRARATRQSASRLVEHAARAPEPLLQLGQRLFGARPRLIVQSILGIAHAPQHTQWRYVGKAT